MHTETDLLSAAVRDPYRHVHALLTNPHTPPAALTALADAFNRVGIHDHTAAAIASHRNAPTDLTAAAATHTNPHVRRIIAESPHTPSNLLDILTGDPHPLVATAAATNPHTHQPAPSHASAATRTPPTFKPLLLPATVPPTQTHSRTWPPTTTPTCAAPSPRTHTHHQQH